MKKIIFLALFLLYLFTACSKDTMLRESVFIEDPDYPGLPMCTEWGYNTFGIYFDRNRFVSNDSKIPVKIIAENDTTLFLFKGSKVATDYYDYSDMSMSLYIPGFAPKIAADLMVLNDSIIDLTKYGCKLTLTMDGTSISPTILNGNIHFIRVQNLIVDDEAKEVILSGKFEFQMRINQEPVSFSDGRFDLGIGYQNFFSF